MLTVDKLHPHTPIQFELNELSLQNKKLRAEFDAYSRYYFENQKKIIHIGQTMNLMFKHGLTKILDLVWKSWPSIPWNIKWYLTPRGSYFLQTYFWIGMFWAWNDKSIYYGTLFAALSISITLYTFILSVFQFNLFEMFMGFIRIIWISMMAHWMLGKFHDLEFPSEASIESHNQGQASSVLITLFLINFVFHFIVKPLGYFPSSGKPFGNKAVDLSQNFLPPQIDLTDSYSSIPHPYSLPPSPSQLSSLHSAQSLSIPTESPPHQSFLSSLSRFFSFLSLPFHEPTFLLRPPSPLLSPFFSSIFIPSSTSSSSLPSPPHQYYLLFSSWRDFEGLLTLLILGRDMCASYSAPVPWAIFSVLLYAYSLSLLKLSLNTPRVLIEYSHYLALAIWLTAVFVFQLGFLFFDHMPSPDPSSSSQMTQAKEGNFAPDYWTQMNPRLESGPSVTSYYSSILFPLSFIPLILLHLVWWTFTILLYLRSPRPLPSHSPSPSSQLLPLPTPSSSSSSSSSFSFPSSPPQEIALDWLDISKDKFRPV